MLCPSCGGYESHVEGCSDAQQREHAKEPALGTGNTGDQARGADDARRKTLSGLRAAVAAEQEKVVAAPVKPLVFRNDYGQIISERAWNMLQKKKEDAKKGGYVLDEYSQ